VKKVAEWLAAGERPTEAHELQARKISEAMNHFDQLFSGDVIGWTHSVSGNRISPEAEARNKQFISSDASWPSVKAFQQIQSQAANAEAKAAIGQSKSAMTRLYWQAYLGMEDTGVGYKGIKGYSEEERQRERAKAESAKEAAQVRPHTGGDEAYMTPEDAAKYNVLGAEAFKRYKAAVKNVKQE
jgi:hypothetical protein